MNKRCMLVLGLAVVVVGILAFDIGGPIARRRTESSMISKDKSCAAAVARILGALVTSGREPCSAHTGAYCKSRQELSGRFLRRLTVTVAQGVEDAAPDAWRWQGRALLVDGTTVNAPDTPANQKAYPQSRSQKPEAFRSSAWWCC